MTDPSIQQKVDDIFALYEQHGAEEYYGEAVTQLEHMCQSAELARTGGYDDEVVLAAFFHDIGYLIHSRNKETMGSYGRTNHEKEAGAFLRSMGFSERVAQLAEQHVNAKRYLTYADPAYYDRLSEASKKTLEYQGGPMKEAEAKAFREDPLFDLNITMRKWDEEAKLTGQPLPDLNIYKHMAIHHLERQQAKSI
ncbi:MAG: HDIG domain-containing protein [Bacteroidetes bacterium]|nr:HDIG domain-containing protein [Bacteroidota bacterium]